MNFLSFFKRDKGLDSFIAIKYGIPTERCQHEIIQKWIFTLPPNVAANTQSELYKRGIIATPVDTTFAHKDRKFVLVNLAVSLVGTKEVLDIIKKHLRKLES